MSYKEGVHLGQVGTCAIKTELENVKAEVLQGLHHATLVLRVVQEGDEDELRWVNLLQ